MSQTLVRTKRRGGFGNLSPRALGLAMAAAALLGGASAASAQELSPAAGGSGGTAFDNLCPQGKILIGVRGREGGYVDQVEGICASLNSIIMPTAEDNTAGAGGTGGSPFEQRCPSGWAVIGLRVRSGIFVDAIKIRCGRLGTSGGTSGVRTHLVYAGGGGGGSPVDNDCPDGLPAMGLKGRAAGWVDRIQLRCAVATIAPVVPIDPNRPDLRVANRDYPVFVTNFNDEISWRVELWNVGGVAATNASVNITVPSGGTRVFVQHPAFTREVLCDANGRCTLPDPLPPGYRAVISVTARPNTVTARADVNNAVIEGSETNNTDSRTAMGLLQL